MRNDNLNKKIFYPNNINLIYSIFISLIIILILVFQIHLLADSFGFLIIFGLVVLLNFYFLYSFLSYSIMVDSEGITVRKMFGTNCNFPYYNHHFVFRGTLIRRDNPAKTNVNYKAVYKKLMWVYPIDAQGELLKMESSYYEWDMFNRSYIKLQNLIEHNCQHKGLDNHILRSKNEEVIVQEI